MKDAAISYEPPHPLLVGLASMLPKGTAWTQRDAEEWLTCARAVFDLVYKWDEPPSSPD